VFVPNGNEVVSKPLLTGKGPPEAHKSQIQFKDLPKEPEWGIDTASSQISKETQENANMVFSA